MDKYTGIYIGLVIQNNDPEMRGRIKIYVPHISTSMLATTIDNTKADNINKAFNFVDSKNNIDLKVLEELKNVLPWAEYAGPIFGGNASGRYNAELDKASTSDSNAWDGDNQVEGFRPAQNFVGHLSQPDSFTSVTSADKNRFANEYAYQYSPSNYSGLAKGVFSIPNVGAHVYIFFREGDPLFPVYFAAVYSQDDIKRIYTLSQDSSDNASVDYPTTYENKKDNEITAEDKTFRSKHVINSNKHTIEMVDTDLREILKFTHYSGSFKEFGNYATIELAANNDQKMVVGDQFLTVKRRQSNFIQGDRDVVIGGDSFKTVGLTQKQTIDEILKIQRQIHDFKLLFDVQRTTQSSDKFIYGNPNDMSSRQNMIGNTIKIGNIAFQNGFRQCPVCLGIPYNPFDPTYTQGNAFYTVDKMWLQAPLYVGGTCNELTLSAAFGPSDCQSFWKFEEQIQANGIPTGEPKPELVAAQTTTCLDPTKVFFVKQIHPLQLSIDPFVYKGTECHVCGGTGFSPSTENGSFNPEPAKQKGGALDQLILTKSLDLLQLEKQFGEGGDEIITIAGSKIENIGLAMNDLKSFRVDPIGKLRIDGCFVAAQGTYEDFKPSPYIEYVDVVDIPGGDYNLTVSNKYKLLVGARGINIKTFGPLDIYGGIVNFNGEQINMASQNEINIDGGENLVLRGRKLSLVPFDHNPAVIEGQLHVTRNSIIQGGLMLEGEMGLLHITAPLEWQRTEEAIWGPEPSCVISALILDVPTPITVPPHFHFFKNLPLHLLPHREAVRDAMITKGINSRSRIAAASPTSNPVGCSESIWSGVQANFAEVAWEKTRQDAIIKGVDVGNDWAQYTATSGPMSYVSRSCTTQSSISPETPSNITIVANYSWKFGNDSGAVSVTGTVTEEGEIIGELI